jgi:hypothetical protein
MKEGDGALDRVRSTAQNGWRSAPTRYRRCVRACRANGRSGPPYNRGVTEFDADSRSAILSRDTNADVERLQIEAWRRMSPLEKTGVMSQASSDALTLALSGIRQRHPGASDRECFIRLAALQLGSTLVRQVYPDASQILGPHE